MPFSFGHPWALLALLALPVLVYLSRRSRAGLEPARSVVSMVIRSVLMVLLVLALADAHWMRTYSRTATLFLVDVSYSVPGKKQEAVQEFVRQQLDEMPEGDRVGVIVFGGDSMIELSPTATPALEGVHSVVDRTATDLSAAIRLAVAAFPHGFQKRILILTDGNENRGRVLQEIEAARGHGATVDVVPLRYEYPGEVWVQGLHVPRQILPREPFEVRVVVHAEQAGEARLKLSRNKDPVVNEPVTLKKGKNTFSVIQKIESAGPYTYEAVVVAEGDILSQNNRAFAFTSSRGGSRVLLVGGRPKDWNPLATALAAEGLIPTVLDPEELAGRVPELSEYDLIIFVNVSASDVRINTMSAIEAAVQDAGTGFIMVGGENSFGPGGYRGTPMEKVLPVTMEQPQHRVIPNGALVLILHTAEIPEGNYWAKQIGLAALNTMSTKDYMGVVLYGAGEQWLFKPTMVGNNRGKLKKLISGASPGDMPDFDRTMRMAHAELKKVDAGSKHVVIISDADPSGPDPKLVDAMIKDRITISTISIYPHGGSDILKMKAIAKRAKGRNYTLGQGDEHRLPRIFIKEAATVQRSMLIEKPFRPVVRGAPEFLKGIPSESLPPLHGYVLTNPKPAAEIMMLAQKSDALLVQWRAGLGRTIAWTSDASARWGKEWLSWADYQRFWSQLVRTAIRTVERGEYTMSIDISRGKGHVVVDAVDETGRFVHTLRFRGSASGPAGERHPLDFRQTGPGRYEAEFEPGEVGIYTVNARYEDARGEEGFLTRGAALSYVLEYRDLKTNDALLQRVVDASGGRLLGPGDSVYATPTRPALTPVPLWPLALVLLVILFPLDVFVRRVALEYAQVRKLWSWMSRRPEKPKDQIEGVLSGLLEKKREIRAVKKPVATSESVDLHGGLGPAGPEAPPDKPAAELKKKEAKPEGPDYLKRLLDAKRKAKKE